MAKHLTKPICFFVSGDMSEQLQQVARSREVSVSQLIRSLIRDFLRLDRQEGSANGSKES